jgi:protoporphyrinogen oxidase
MAIVEDLSVKAWISSDIIQICREKHWSNLPSVEQTQTEHRNNKYRFRVKFNGVHFLIEQCTNQLEANKIMRERYLGTNNKSLTKFEQVKLEHVKPGQLDRSYHDQDQH